jgi:hypothetical protein
MANNFEMKNALAQNLTFKSTETSGVHTPHYRLDADENHIGAVGGHVGNVAASFSRPADTTAYAAGDLVANSVTAGSVAPMTFAAARLADKGFMIRRARIKKSTAGLTAAAFRLHLYRQSPVVGNGDNGAWLSDEKTYLGSIDVTMDRAFSDGAAGIGAPNNGSDISGLPNTGTVNIFGLLEARAAYTPGNVESFTVTLEIHQD